MSTPTLPEHAIPYGAPSSEPSRPWTAAAYLALMAYLLWLPIMFAVAYWVTGWFDVEPGTGPTMASQSAAGWLINAGFSLLAGLPGWVAAVLAVRAIRMGGRAASWVALVLGVATSLGLLVTGALAPL